MPLAQVRGIEINYEVFGDSGDWIALTPGSRNPYGDFVSLARRFAAAGYRVLLHDRRNCGASDVAIEGTDSENAIWADDLHALLGQLGALPAYIGGSSSGCRLSILFALRHPQAVRGLLLWRITGGSHAAAELAEFYYGQYIAMARTGGMAAVCASEHFRARIAARPVNGERLMKMAPEQFIAVMTRWRDDILRGAAMPIIGASEADLRSIAVPACLIPGNDRIHNPAAARTLARLLPHSETHEVVGRRAEDDLLPDLDRAEWDRGEEKLAAIFLGFLERLKAERRS